MEEYAAFLFVLGLDKTGLLGYDVLSLANILTFLKRFFCHGDCRGSA